MISILNKKNHHDSHDLKVSVCTFAGVSLGSSSFFFAETLPTQKQRDNVIDPSDVNLLLNDSKRSFRRDQMNS